MTKYGRHLRFGYCPIPTAANPTKPLRLAGRAETLELDYICIQDHPDGEAHHDAWTLLTAIGVTTSTISVFPNLNVFPMRSPAQLAKAAASLDLLTNGRVEMGLGAGTAQSLLGFVGGEARRDEEKATLLDEAMQIMRLMWSGERSARFEGKLQQIDDIKPGPAPAHPINIWLGANEPHTLALVGRSADGWMPDAYPLVQPDALARLSKQVDEAAASADREPSAIQRIWAIRGSIAKSAGNGDNRTPFQGSAQQWAETLADLAMDVGIDTLLLVEGEDAEEQLERFAREVIPRTRELVDHAGGVAHASGLERASQGADASGATEAEEETGDVDSVDEASMESFPASDPPSSESFT